MSFPGVVMEAGEGVTAFKAGDAIMAAPTAPCGICFYCQHGQENLCDDAVGRMVHGAYADTLVLPAHVVARNTFIKPADLPFEEAALLEPLSCVVHAQEMARPEKNETVVIIGGGAFGLLHMLVLKAAGVREVVVVGRGAERLKWAGELGADRVIDARSADAAAEIAQLNGGFGPDLVIECTGQVEGWQDALARVRRGGRVVFFGGCPAGTALSVDTRRMHYDNLTLMAPFHYRPRDVRRAYELLAGRALNAGAIVNARMRLDRFGRSVRDARARRGVEVRRDSMRGEDMTQAIEIGNTAVAMSNDQSPHDEFVAKIDYTVDRAQRALLDLQKPEGYWHAPLEANAEMNAEFIIFNHFMDTVDVETEARLKKHLLDTQSPDGSWALYQGGEGYLSTTIESYFALKLTGMRAGDEPMAAARRWILSKGGIVNCGTLARFYLASMGQITVGSDGRAAGRAVAVPELVPVQHLRAWFVGARNADGIDDAAGGAARKKDRLPARSARALHRAAAFHQVQTAARKKIVLAAQRAELRRQGAALLRSAQNKIAARPRAATHRRMAPRASGGQRLVGRNRAVLPAQRDGSESQRLPQRPSGAEARRSRRRRN